MFFSKAQTQVLDNLSIFTSDGKIIERVPSYKYLGIWIDDNFLFHVHIANLIRKLKLKLGFYFFSGSYQLRSSKCFLFNVPRVCTELGKTAFSHYAPWAWNNLQKDLKLDKFVSIGEFKGILKRVVLEACDCFC